MTATPRHVAAGLLALACACAALASPAAALDLAAEPTPTSAPTDKPRFGTGFFLVPNFTSDFGFGLGLVGSLFRFAHGIEPYQFDIDAGLYATTGGMRMAGFLTDFPQIGGSKWRLNTMLAYNRNLGATYYGIGNSGQATPGKSSKYNYYDLEDPTLRVYVRRPLWRSLLGYFGVRLSSDHPRAAADSLVAATRPYGIAGGAYNQINLGLLWDSRDNEHNPHSGTLAELSARSALHLLGSAHQTYSLFVSWAHYQPLARGLVLATRLAFDRQWGDVPFTHMDDFGGLFPASGLGGSNTLRGVLSNQFMGKVKVLGNVEGRLHLFATTISERPLEIGAVAFSDIGRAWATQDADGPLWNLQKSLGAGLRLVWDKVFVLRADVGFVQDGYRIYVDYWQAF